MLATFRLACAAQGVEQASAQAVCGVSLTFYSFLPEVEVHFEDKPRRCQSFVDGLTHELAVLRLSAPITFRFRRACKLSHLLVRVPLATSCYQLVTSLSEDVTGPRRAGDRMQFSSFDLAIPTHLLAESRLSSSTYRASAQT
ncbi:MAG: hypothetical protein E6R03_01615 [Hyphomicrobiaceae bacterium]|nr:MAG: hypothetical protein E6R03_01615 [Hyphomicrobiaceae bacterium]